MSTKKNVYKHPEKDTREIGNASSPEIKNGEKETGAVSTSTEKNENLSLQSVLDKYNRIQSSDITSNLHALLLEVATIRVMLEKGGK